MVTKIATVTILILAFFCASAIAQTKPTPQVIITIRRQAGLGCSPDYSAEIYSDGTVVYHGVACVKVEGEKRHQISTDRVAQLVKAFDQADYFSFKDAYEVDEAGRSWTDSPRTTTSISLNGKYKKVVDYIAPPKELVALEELIEKLAGLYQYIGPL
jgi:Domain of unknown function (DUF6438)